MDPVLTSSQADPEHAGQNWDHKHVRKQGKLKLQHGEYKV
jgi:hypothetical protein